MTSKVETIKTKVDMGRIGFWASCLYDMFNGDKKRMEQRLYILCNDRFINPEECRPIIKELIGRI